MKTRGGFALFLLLVLVGTGMGQEKKETSSGNLLRLAGNGVWWDSLADGTKWTFADGYTTAMARANSFVGGECKERKNGLAPGSGFDAEMKAAIASCMTAEIFNFNVERPKLLSGIDDFYSDSQNLRIPIDFAMQHVREMSSLSVRSNSARAIQVLCSSIGVFLGRVLLFSQGNQGRITGTINA